MSFSRLLINRIPLWRGQTRKGVRYAPAILESMTHEIVNNRYPIISNFVKDRCLNHSNDYKNSIIGINNNFLNNIPEHKNGDLVLNLGGDHGISIGTIPPMLVKHPNLKVIWVDAHADINSPITSISGNFHGMPLYFISELCDKEYDYNIFQNKLLLKDLTYFGVRDMDDAEKKILEKHNIQNYIKKDINDKGISNVIDDLIEKNDLNNNPIHLSLDIDGLDPDFCPSTGTRSGEGLLVSEVVELCRRIKETGNLVSIDLVEFNPLIGDENDVEKTVSSVEKILRSIL